MNIYLLYLNEMIFHFYYIILMGNIADCDLVRAFACSNLGSSITRTCAGVRRTTL